ncbi:cytosolic purine 5'-nucleotidase [Medicago truncatula]|uniref:Cytosolic purine 5-nucleotidase n=1 Tax=Medicago truncatula TaxID=3880 RepID=G7KH03_MEDTR|nr:cytosolic purine 5'-nucleotidase [Medicago truncatula]AES99585.2 cytosolic purine 5-nucleotidase [Medicago truncatula]
MNEISVESPGCKSAKTKTDTKKQIFCNRPLNMRNVNAVGFDMDYTLAQYKPETFESLTYKHTVRKLVHNLKYPVELLNWSFNPSYMVRGLVLDKKRGNILKMDCHKYVKIAYHGFEELSKDRKVEAYGKFLVSNSFDEPEYALIDTLFSLAEAYLFAQLVDFCDRNPGSLPSDDYACLYKDVRNAVDMCHRDGTLKQKLAEDPKRYIHEDESIVPMLKMLKESGRATFLVTNSLWDYTSVVMNFICGSGGVNDSTNFDWLEYFDVVITGSAKPNFFQEDNHANLFEVEPESGVLRNTNNGSPLPQVGNFAAKISTKDNNAHKVFQGGNVSHLYPLLKIETSSQILYAGDHIYGDILSSKKTLGWRTMLVIPELDKEVQLLWELRDDCKKLRSLRNDRDDIEKEMHFNQSLKSASPDDDTKQKFISKIQKLEHEREKMRSDHQEALRKLHQEFHETWGQLMKTGYQNSRFAHQVKRFACLYTSQVSNLGSFSPEKYYTPSEDLMQHEYNSIFES